MAVRTCCRILAASAGSAMRRRKSARSRLFVRALEVRRADEGRRDVLDEAVVRQAGQEPHVPLRERGERRHLFIEVDELGVAQLVEDAGDVGRGDALGGRARRPRPRAGRAASREFPFAKR